MVVADAPAKSRIAFRYDPGTFCWMATSRSQRGREHEIHWAISGYVLITTCGCKDSSCRKHVCAHQDEFAKQVLPKITPGAEIRIHASCGNGPIDLRVATEAERKARHA